MWRGRKAIGEEIMLGLQCVNSTGVPTAPDAAPTMKIYTSSGAGVLVLSKAIPPREQFTATGLFEYEQPLNSSFSTGRHVVRYTYSISSTAYVGEPDFFEIVAGGSSNGMKDALFCLDRPDQRDWVLTTTDMGTLAANRGPKV